jgi:hypothetical protein
MVQWTISSDERRELGRAAGELIAANSGPLGRAAGELIAAHANPKVDQFERPLLRFAIAHVRYFRVPGTGKAAEFGQKSL